MPRLTARAASSRRNALVGNYETILQRTKDTGAGDVQIPCELIDKHVDEAKTPDGFSEEVFQRSNSVRSRTRGSISALHNLREAVGELAQQHGLVDRPSASSAGAGLARERR